MTFDIPEDWDEDDPYWDDGDMGYDEDLFDDEDFGFLGSFLERQLVDDGQKICPECGKKVASVLDTENPNPCPAKCHRDFKALFDVRLKIGEHDLRVRGFD